MSRSFRRHVRGNVVGYIALFFSLGLGTAWAAGLERNEVKSKHIAPGQVKVADIADDSVTAAKVLDGSLLDDDFAAGQLPAGERGQQGLRGQQGEQGEQGIQGTEGPEGSAAAYALIENGNVFAPLSRNVIQADITRPSAGFYCIDVPF